MEAARVAAVRGHKVTLIEKNGYLGGNIVPGGVPDFKDDDRALVKWYEGILKDLGVEIKLNVDASKENIKEFGADEVLLATGSSPRTLTIEGSDNVYSAEDVLMERKMLVKRLL